MSSEPEMRRVLLHAAAKLRGSAYPQMQSEAKMAMAYAEGVLELLASYLKVEEAPQQPVALARPKPPGRPDAPRNEHGQFVKESA